MTAPVSPQPDAPAADADPSVEFELPRIQVDFPGFSVLASRQGKVIRSPCDHMMDVAEVRDVQAVAAYAAQCAIIATQTVNDGMFNFYQNQLQLLANNFAIGIQMSIARYDRERRAAVWYRRAWRWARSFFDHRPTITAQPIRTGLARPESVVGSIGHVGETNGVNPETIQPSDETIRANPDTGQHPPAEGR